MPQKRFHNLPVMSSNLSSNFKACDRYFYQILIYSPNDSPSKTMKKLFLFHLKSSFRSRDIQIFHSF